MQPYYYKTIVIQPNPMQFVIDELPMIFTCMAGLVYGGMNAVTLGGVAIAVSLFLLLVLLSR